MSIGITQPWNHMKTMQTHSNSESAQVWSTMVPHPLCYYDEHYDAHMVAWNGVVMTRSYAMLLVSSIWMHMYPANSQKEAVLSEFVRLLGCGAFEYTGSTGSHYDVMSHLKWKLINNDKNSNYITNMRVKYSAKEAFSWFMPERERTLVRQYETQQ